MGINCPDLKAMTQYSSFNFSNTKNIIIEGNEGYKKAQNFMKMMMPSHVKKIKKYRGKNPLFIEEYIAFLLCKIALLCSLCLYI